jgi:hypothetical protein
MNTKGFLLSLGLLFGLSAASSAQDLQVALKQKLEHYVDLSNKGEWEQLFDQTYPKLYTNVSKAELVAMMKQNQEGMDLQSSNLNIRSVSAPIEEGNETFVRIDYEADLTVKIKPGGVFDDPKPIMGLEQQFKDSYGDRNVRYNSDTREFSIRSHSAMMAIREGNGEWRFAEINTKQPKVMEFLFSPSIREALVNLE